MHLTKSLGDPPSGPYMPFDLFPTRDLLGPSKAAAASAVDPEE